MPRTRTRHVRAALVIAGLALAAVACSVTEDVSVSQSETVEAEAPSRTSNEPTTPPDAAPAEVPATAEPVETQAAEDDEAPTSDDEAKPSLESSDADDCAYLGIDDFGDMQIELSFIAPRAPQDDMIVRYLIRAADGAVLVTSETFVEDVRPGEQFLMLVDTVEDGPPEAGVDSGITCEFAGLEPFDFGSQPYRASDFDLCRLAGVDEFGDLQVEIVVTNPTGGAAELAIDYALRGADGVRFDDGVAYTSDVIAENQQTTLQVDTFSEYPDWVDSSSFSCVVLAIEGF